MKSVKLVKIMKPVKLVKIVKLVVKILKIVKTSCTRLAIFSVSTLLILQWAQGLIGGKSFWMSKCLLKLSVNK